jgi:L-ascorbate metabolism protein UlaG (beta-lactamase superfamily)
MDEILSVDALIVTHTHPDHWDEAAGSQVPKHLPLFAQHEADAELIRSQGFTDVRILSNNTTFNRVSLVITPGQHGSDQALSAARHILGDVCGVVFNIRTRRRCTSRATRSGTSMCVRVSPNTSRRLSFLTPGTRRCRASAQSS